MYSEEQDSFEQNDAQNTRKKGFCFDLCKTIFCFSNRFKTQ